MITFESITAIAQSSFPSVTTNWERTVQNVQLLISTTNSVVESGSSGAVMAVIRNGTTNAIVVYEMGPTFDFGVSLTNTAGQLYQLTSRPDRTMVARVTVESGKQLASTIPVTYGKNIQPGQYTLIATRSFSSSAGNFKMESNQLEIQIGEKADGP